MKIYEAIGLLKDESIILKNQIGELFQRENTNLIFKTYVEATKPTECSIGGTMHNQEFIEAHISDDFEKVPQWYDNIKFPILCKVKESGWTGYKIVGMKYRNGSILHTGFGESYCICRRLEIMPLLKEECLELFYD